jgi:hypothetical protein
MSRTRHTIGGLSAGEAAQHVMNNDIADLFEQAEVVRERRPAKMVTALRMDLETQIALEAAAQARGIGVSTLMREIIVEWVDAHRGEVAPDQVSELVRHLDAARQVAAALATRDAA